VFSIIACGTDDTGSDQYPPIDDQTSDARVVLDARVSGWTDTSQSIIVNYEMSKNGDTEIIVLANRTLQTDRKPDGTLRLFRGKQDTGNVDIELTPIINGESLAPATSLSGSGSQRLPLRIDYPID